MSKVSRVSSSSRVFLTPSTHHGNNHGRERGTQAFSYFATRKNNAVDAPKPSQEIRDGNGPFYALPYRLVTSKYTLFYLWRAPTLCTCAAILQQRSVDESGGRCCRDAACQNIAQNVAVRSISCTVCHALSRQEVVFGV